MDKNKVIILALIAIIAVLLVGFAAMMPNTNRQDTKLTFKCNDTLTEGDSVKIKLTDNNGIELANQEVNITIIDDKNRSDYHSVVTDDDGVGSLEIDKSAGNYTIAANYGGNENYNGCNATEKITIEEQVVEDIQSESSNSYSSSQNSIREEDKVTSDGWNPNEHEVSRESIDNGYEKVRYDDDYFRVVDKDGNIITYGYGG